MKEILSLIKSEAPYLNFNNIAVGVIDFRALTYKYCEIYKGMALKRPSFFFDLASLTKPLTLATSYLISPKLFNNDMTLLLNHNAGLPSWGRVSKKSWKEQILNYSITPSKECYSDFSALRLMLELGKENFKIHDLVKEISDNELMFWKDIENKELCVKTGFRNQEIIRGQVNDDNAFVIDEFCSHAGLFSTINGLCKTLLNIESLYCLLANMSLAFNRHDNNFRFIQGWDRVTDLDNTLAGKGCSKKTFGHLGFTGTSIWIDCEKQIGHVILTNATEQFWYERRRLNNLRRSIGEVVWNMRK